MDAYDMGEERRQQEGTSQLKESTRRLRRSLTPLSPWANEACDHPLPCQAWQRPAPMCGWLVLACESRCSFQRTCEPVVRHGQY